MSVISKERKSESMNVVHTLYRAGFFSGKVLRFVQARMTFSLFDF